jgi:tRNA(Ile)-lysidine synthase
VRRAAIREALAAEGETWIDDPLNQDLRSPRARARLKSALADSPLGRGHDGDLGWLAAKASVGVGGDIRIDRQLLRSAPHAAVRRLIGAAATCAGGRTGPARGARIEALTDRILATAPFAGVLSGAKALANSEVQFTRDAGEAARGGLQPLQLQPGETGVWDGRFEITAGAEPTTIARMAGHAAAVDRVQFAALKSLPASVRPGLPVSILADGAPVCPILAKDRSIKASLLVAERFFAACGVISKEPAA